MTINTFKRSILVFAFAFFASLFLTTEKADAHCNSLDGPVVTAATRALEEENINRILIWVKKEDEEEISEIFKKVLKARKQGIESGELADRYLFENLVRIHRRGEGASYDGLLEAGHDFGPIINNTDRAFENGNISPVLSMIKNEDAEEVEEAFKKVYGLKNFPVHDVVSGGEYVEAYVKFIHHVEELYNKEHPENSANHEGEGHEKGVHKGKAENVEQKRGSSFLSAVIAFLAGAGAAGGIMKLLSPKKGKKSPIGSGGALSIQ